MLESLSCKKSIVTLENLYWNTTWIWGWCHKETADTSHTSTILAIFLEYSIELILTKHWYKTICSIYIYISQEGFRKTKKSTDFTVLAIQEIWKLKIVHVFKLILNTLFKGSKSRFLKRNKWDQWMQYALYNHILDFLNELKPRKSLGFTRFKRL